MERYQPEFKSEFNDRHTLLTKKILRALSENSRVPILELSKKLGVSRRTIKERIKKVEQELGIRYTIELNESALGLNYPHIIMLKFTHKPDYKEVAQLMEKYYIPQTVFVTKGKFDMAIFANSVTSQDYVHWDKTMQILLSKYGVLWQASDVAHRQLGFFPARNALIDRLSIPSKYKEMLKLLNDNSRISFKQISQKLNMHFNTVAYNFKKLIKLGYIKRFTLVMRPQRNTSIISVFGKYTMSENFEADAARFRKDILTNDDPQPIISRLAFSSQLVGSYDYFLIGVFDSYEKACKHLVQYYRENFRRHKIKVLHGEIESLLIGDLPIRNIDVKKEYDVIKWIVEPSETDNLKEIFVSN
ncbi:MAG: winged helix-turn-helix transcriptional regulator [Candidatus Micrarchaeaceae archaeon]